MDSGQGTAEKIQMDDEFGAVLYFDDNPFGAFELAVGDDKAFAWNEIRADLYRLRAADKFKLADVVEVFEDLLFRFFRDRKNADDQAGCLDLPVLLAVQQEKNIAWKHGYVGFYAMAACHAVVQKRRQIP